MSAIILCYHKIGPQIDEGRRLNLDPSRLRAHVGYFHRSGHRFVPAGKLAQDWSENTVCLSFDDAYWSTLEWGVSVLDTFGVPGTFYAVSSLVASSSVWDPATARPLAGWAALLEAQKHGHEIGNHTATHARLADLPYAGQVLEIRTCDEALRSHGLKPASFCYPYGSFSADTERAVAECGYGVGLALLKRVAVASDNRLALPRIIVGFSDSLPALLYKVHLRPRLRR